MPSSTPRQARFFAAIAHDPAFAAKAGVPQKVGQEFNQADKGTGILKKKKSRVRIGNRQYDTDALGNMITRRG